MSKRSFLVRVVYGGFERITGCRSNAGRYQRCDSRSERCSHSRRTVTVTNPATNFVRSAISNEAGVYNFPFLQPGADTTSRSSCRVSARYAERVELQIQQSARLDFTLQVGD